MTFQKEYADFGCTACKVTENFNSSDQAYYQQEVANLDDKMDKLENEIENLRTKIDSMQNEMNSFKDVESLRQQAEQRQEVQIIPKNY